MTLKIGYNSNLLNFKISMKIMIPGRGKSTSIKGFGKIFGKE
jgi:hypothetical protein